MAIVEAECRESWTWFLEFLKEDLDIYHSSHYSFMSDKQKGLEQAIKELFSDAGHRHCVRHLYNNFKNDGHRGLELKQNMWAVARRCTLNTFTAAMEDMKKSSVPAWQWCMDRPAIHWSKSHFYHKFKCDLLLNNHSESFNNSILQARKKPILSCLEEVRTQTMVRMANRRTSRGRWRCKVGPRVEKTLKKEVEWSSEYRAIQSSPWRFEIQGRGVACQTGVVAAQSIALDLKICTLMRWDVSGIPCGNVVAAIFSLGESPDDFVNDYFTEDVYMKAYEPVLFPIAGVIEWEKIHRPIAPPLYRRQPGRPKTARNKEPGEVAQPPGTTKLPKVYYSQEGNNVQQEEHVNVQEQGAENVQHEEAVHVEEESTVNVTQHEAHIAQQQESQPAFLPTQQSKTSIAQEGSSMLQFKHRRFKSLAQRKPKPKNAPSPSATSDE